MTVTRVLSTLLLLALSALGLAGTARALEPVSVTQDVDAIDLSPAVQFYSGQGDRIQIQTAPASDGIVRRIEVRAKEAGASPNWIVFALANTTNEQIDRILVAPHFRLVGSGLVWPDLGASRIADITPSQGFRPEREDSEDADVFRVTLDPGSRITFVAELRTAKLPQLYLWDPDAYKDKINSLTLYKGIVMGIAGLLALFLTIAFVVKGTAMFPAAAALAWAVLAYLAIDFGFLHKVLSIQADGDRTWRAGAEAIFSATLLVFLFAYLNLNRWHVRYSYVSAAWLIALAALVGLAVVDAPTAAGVARISIATLAFVGLLIIVFLAVYGYDRAVMLIPTWTLLLFWVIAAGLTITGNLTNDLVQPALTGGLVLVVMLIGFTVMQHAFAGGITTGIVSDVERRALALTGAGDMIWDWDVSADRVFTSPETETLLGLRRYRLGLGRPGRPHLCQRRRRRPARRQARQPGWAREPLARPRPRPRPRSLPHRARRGHRQPARTRVPGVPHQGPRRSLRVAEPQGAASRRLRRGGRALRRHDLRHHRAEDLGGAAAP